MKKLFSIMVMLVLALFTITSCNKQEDDQKINVKWVDLTSDNAVLKEEKIESDSKLVNLTPEKEG